MIRGMESVTLFSENAKKLAHFYRDKVGLKLGAEAEIGEKGEELYELKMGKGSSGLYIVDHSDIKGKAKEPKRVMVNLEVDNIEKEVERVKKAGVKLIQDIYHVQDYGQIATFADIDGNYFQLVQVRPS